MKQGFFVKNYSVKQIIIDPENFDPQFPTPQPRRFTGKTLPGTFGPSIKEDLIQEASPECMS